MPAYNFQPRFVEFVLDGTKTHTIRAKRKDGHRPRAGQTFYGYHGLRTKACKLLIVTPIVKVEAIKFERARVWIAGGELDAAEKDAFAWRDGFRFGAGTVWAAGLRHDLKNICCFDLMLQFWIETRKTTDFEGDLIHWDFSKRREFTHG